MNILAFDTCFGAVSVCVRWKDAAGTWHQRDAYEEMETGQAERLFPMIAGTMRGADQTFATIDRIAVTHGPGSFTGTRVGVAAARGLALATGRAIVTSTSLSIMAARAIDLGAVRATEALAVAVDARRGGLYLQLFDPTDGHELDTPRLSTPDEGAQLIGTRRTIAVGTGATALAEAARRLGLGPVTAELASLQPHARYLAMRACEFTPVAEVKPLYLRPPDAKLPAASKVAVAE